MIKVCVCVRPQCDVCGEFLTSLDLTPTEAHYASESEALDAASAAGWRVDSRGRLLCSMCGPKLVCQAEGHTFTPWRCLVLGSREHPVNATEHPELATVVALGGPIRRDYRYCTRCCRHESRTPTGCVGLHVPGEPVVIHTGSPAPVAVAVGEVA
jgi:hypothetical protein